jgi:pullulanase
MFKFLLLLVVSFSAWADFRPVLKNWYGKEVHVYLPKDYSAGKSNYPVLFMHDGQNLYDPSRAYLGQTWRAEATLNELIERKIIKPIIVVAIDNSPARMDEYTHDRDEGRGGNADAYLDQIVHELRPLILKNFRVSSSPQKTGIMGSSLGGLVSLYAGVKYPEVFGLVGALSPSIWWNNKSILAIYKSSTRLPSKIYLDSGTVGGESPEDIHLLRDVLNERGSSPYIYVQDGASHSEKYWAERLPLALHYLFQ